jgi:ATP-binding cassette subfamily B (MDR/TAP) protein 1
MEQRFEEIVSETFSDSVGFASECIQAIKSVNCPNMEERIEDRIGALLKDHCGKAQWHAINSMIWFALGESIELLCMGLIFWYVSYLTLVSAY